MAKFVCLSGTREGKGKVVVQPAHPESDLPPGGAREWASSPPVFSVGHMRVESPSTALFSIHIANFYRLNAHTYNFFKSRTRFVIHSLSLVQKSFSGGSYGKESACQHRWLRRCGFDPWVGKIPWRRKWQPSLVSLPEKSHGHRSLVGYSPWIAKNGTRLSDWTT